MESEYDIRVPERLALTGATYIMLLVPDAVESFRKRFRTADPGSSLVENGRGAHFEPVAKRLYYIRLS